MNFFKPYQTYILGKGTVVASNYITALIKEGFILTQAGVEYHLTSPEGKLVAKHYICKDGWALFLESIPKHLLPFKTLLNYFRTK